MTLWRLSLFLALIPSVAYTHPCDKYKLVHESCYPHCNRQQRGASIARWSSCMRSVALTRNHSIHRTPTRVAPVTTEEPQKR